MSKTSIEWLPESSLNDCRTSGQTMGTHYSARFHAPRGADLHAIVAALHDAVTAVDRQMSNWRTDSDLSRLNRARPGEWTPIPANLVTVLTCAMEVGRASGNAFNIGVGDLVDAWGFGPNASSHPLAPLPRQGVDALLEIDVPGSRARKHAEVVLDLCGIAKGFGVDELARVLDARGIGSWLVGIDGEMRARGTKPDGSAWAIALEAPDETQRTSMGVIELRDAAIATSGDYRHWADVLDRRISHTMDPRTGAPLFNTVTSVTVVCERCMEADAYATALMVLGENGGLEFAEQADLDSILVMRDQGQLRCAGSGFFARP